VCKGKPKYCNVFCLGSAAIREHLTYLLYLVSNQRLVIVSEIEQVNAHMNHHGPSFTDNFFLDGSTIEAHNLIIYSYYPYKFVRFLSATNHRGMPTSLGIEPLHRNIREDIQKWMNFTSGMFIHNILGHENPRGHFLLIFNLSVIIFSSPGGVLIILTLGFQHKSQVHLECNDFRQL
jgi:hypothetical protein